MSASVAPQGRLISSGKSVTLRFPHHGHGSREVSYDITEKEHNPSEGKLSLGSLWGSILLRVRSIGQEVVLPEPENNVITATVVDVI